MTPASLGEIHRSVPATTNATPAGTTILKAIKKSFHSLALKYGHHRSSFMVLLLSFVTRKLLLCLSEEHTKATDLP